MQVIEIRSSIAIFPVICQTDYPYGPLMPAIQVLLPVNNKSLQLVM